MTSHSHYLRSSTRTRHGHRLEAWCGATSYSTQLPRDEVSEQPPDDACRWCFHVWQAQQHQRTPEASATDALDTRQHPNDRPDRRAAAR